MSPIVPRIAPWGLGQMRRPRRPASCGPTSSPPRPARAPVRARPSWRRGSRTTGACGGTSPTAPRSRARRCPTRRATSASSTALPAPGRRRPGGGHRRHHPRASTCVVDRGWVLGVKFRPGGLAALCGLDAAPARRPGRAGARAAAGGDVRAIRAHRGRDADASGRRSGRAALAPLARRARTPLTTTCSTLIDDMLGRPQRRAGRSSRSGTASVGARSSGCSPATSASGRSGCSAATGCMMSSPPSTGGTTARSPTSPPRYGWYDQAHFTPRLHPPRRRRAHGTTVKLPMTLSPERSQPRTDRFGTVEAWPPLLTAHPPRRLPPVRVLVVDDEVNIAELISMALRYEGWQVRRPTPAPRRSPPPARLKPDAVVLDMMLPDFDGLEVLRRMRATAPSHPGPVPHRPRRRRGPGGRPHRGRRRLRNQAVLASRRSSPGSGRWLRRAGAQQALDVVGAPPSAT